MVDDRTERIELTEDVPVGDDATPAETQFALPSVRAALVGAPQASSIMRLVESIEKVPATHPEFVFDPCRALIESVCRTILNDLNEPLPPKPNAENMSALVIKRLGLFGDPKEVEGDLKQAVGESVSGINKLVNGIGKYRRDFGPVSHGRDGYRSSPDDAHALLVVGMTDALASFLFTAHRRLHGEEEWYRAFYGDHPDFDQFLDDEHDPSPINVFGDDYQPSRILFSVNRSAYLKRLNDWRKLRAAGEVDSEGDE